MSLNAMVTSEGGEIGRAQWLQAVAAGAEAEVAMNPVLLKPMGERSSQVVVLGRAVGVQEAAPYQASKRALVDVVDGALASLRARFDVVVCEGAGSPAEINLLEHDIVNLGLAVRAGLPAIVVGDIERGGVFAHLFGTVAILPEELARAIGGFVINRFRGDRALLSDGPAQLEARTGVPTLGVLPFLDGLEFDAEDSLVRSRTSMRRPSARVRSMWRLCWCLVCPTSPTSTRWWPSRACTFAGWPGLTSSGDRTSSCCLVPGPPCPIWPRSGRGACATRSAALRAAPDPPVVLGICGGFQMLGGDDRGRRWGRGSGGSARCRAWAGCPSVRCSRTEKVTRLTAAMDADGSAGGRLRDPARAHGRRLGDHRSWLAAGGR